MMMRGSEFNNDEGKEMIRIELNDENALREEMSCEVRKKAKLGVE